MYATSGSVVSTAGKQKGLTWKKVDDATAKLLSHFPVLNVLPVVSLLDSSIGLYLDLRKNYEAANHIFMKMYKLILCI